MIPARPWSSSDDEDQGQSDPIVPRPITHIPGRAEDDQLLLRQLTLILPAGQRFNGGFVRHARLR
jgi:hypothetical protein